MKEPGNNNRFHDLGVRTVSGLALALVAFLAFRAGFPWSTLLLAAGAAVMLWELHGIVIGSSLNSAFRVSGHVLIALVLGVFGGLVASYFHRASEAES